MFVHLRFNGRALAVSVSNLGCVYITLLDSWCATRSYLLVVHKLKLKLNTRLYTLCSSVFVCVIFKRGINVW